MTSTDQSSAEAAIADLQSRIAFQEDMLQALNRVIATQDTAIARLQEQMQILNRKIEDVADSIGQKDSAAADEPPPHY